MNNLFDEFPAKREDCQNITGSKVFPLPFCGHRWIKDKEVADRALDAWPNIAKYVNETLKKPNSKISGSSSFATLRTAVQDELIVPKLQFFSSTANIMMPYLEKFQGNAPLVPFMTTEVTVLLENLMQKFIKQSELQAANSSSKVAKLNVLVTGIHLETADIDVGFAAAATLTKVLKEKKPKSAKNVRAQERMLCNVGNNCYQNTRKESTEVQLC